MQTTVERELELLDLLEDAAADEPDHHLSPEEAEVIFQMAEAEIQPILKNLNKWRRKDLMYALAEFLCFCLFLSSIAGIFWQCITYPHTLVILYTKAIPASTTAALDLPTRTLPPVTITRAATTATTGLGHQDARAATGTLTLYNGLFTSQSIPAGTVFTGRQSIQVITTATILVPASDPTTNPPQLGYAIVPARAVMVGGQGNIAPQTINTTYGSGISVKNVTFFQNGQDARTFRAVAARDLTAVTQTVNGTVTQALTNAFPLQPGEVAVPTHCTTKATPTHQVGEEAQSVTVTMSKTCAAIAYSQRALTRAATAAFTKTRPGATYHIVGSVRTTFQSVSPLTVTLNGQWAYTFSQSYQDYLAEQIQGDTPAKARAYLLKTGSISYASVPNTLASADYINFYVLVG